MTNFRHAHILGLMSVAVAAYGASAGSELRPALIMAALLAAAAVATVVFERRAVLRAPRAAAAPAAAKGSMVQTKRLLMLMMAIGIVVYGGGAGTFASFSAETSNTNSSVASGTLTMSDTVNGSTATACASATSISQDNVNELPSGQTLNTGVGTTSPTSGSSSLGACDVALTLTNLAPGVFGGYSKIAIQNTGSLDASKFWLFAPYVNTALNTTNGATIALGAPLPNPLPVLPIEGPIKSGDEIHLDYGGTDQIVFASANVDPLSTSIPLTGSPTATVAYPTGTRVYDKSTDGKVSNVPQNTDCFDIRNSQAGIVNATAGTDLNFNKNTLGHGPGNTAWVIDSTNTYTGPLCTKMGFWIQEQSVVNGSTYNYCWYGDGAINTAHAPLTPNGMCRAPINAAFTGSQTIVGGSSYSITPAVALRGNISNGDMLAISEIGKPTAYCIATADEWISATTIAFNNCLDASSSGLSFPSTSFSTAATITDYTTLTDLNTDTQTLANFDTLDGPANKQELVSLVGNGVLSNTGATVTSVELGKKGAVGSASGTIGSAPDTRTFYMGVFFPSGTAQNALQGLKSTFGIGWHIDQ